MLSCATLMVYVYQLQFKAGSRQSLTDYILKLLQPYRRCCENGFAARLSVDAISLEAETPAGDMAPYTSKEMVLSEANAEEK